MKFTAAKVTNPTRAKRVRRFVYAIAIATLLPSIYLTYNMFRESRFSLNAQRFITAQMQFPDTKVLSENAYFSNGKKIIDVTLFGKLLPVDSLKMALTPRLEQYGLEGAQLNILQGEGALPQNFTETTTASDIYNLTQKAMAAKQADIDSLSAIIANQELRDTIGAAMAPELRVVFPEVADIAISRNVFCNVTSQHLDTLELALIKYSQPISADTHKKLRRYLEARLGTRQVHIVDVTRQEW